MTADPTLQSVPSLAAPSVAVGTSAAVDTSGQRVAEGAGWVRCLPDQAALA